MPLDHTAINLIHLTKKWRAAAENTNETHRYRKLNLSLATRRRQKKNNHAALVFWMSFRTGSAKCNEKRGALWSSKNQIDRVLSRIFIKSHCRVRSHNPKRGCACREKKKNPWFRYKARLTLAVAYIRGETNHLYECGLHKTRTAGINGSRLSPRPDQSNDDVVCFGASEQKSETTGFGQENRHILHCRFVFKLTFRQVYS